MGYIFDFKDAGSYDAWFDKGKNKYRLDLEIKLMMDLLSPEKGQRILDIGCGTGISLEPLLDKGLNLTGLDPSPYMLDLASDRWTCTEVQQRISPLMTTPLTLHLLSPALNLQTDRPKPLKKPAGWQRIRLSSVC